MKGDSFAYLKGDILVDLPKPETFIYLNSYASELGEMRNGDVFIYGENSDQGEPFSKIAGYWKSGVWSQLLKDDDGIVNAIYSMTIY